MLFSAKHAEETERGYPCGACLAAQDAFRETMKHFHIEL